MSTTRPASADTAVSSAFDASVSQEKGMSVGGGLKSEEKPEQKHVEGSVDETRILEALSKEHCTIHHVSDDGCYYIKSTKDDPTSPRNWPNWKRYALVILASTLNNIVTIVVSGYSTGAAGITSEFGVDAEVGTVGLTTFILGFALGPMLTAPLSEYYGRRPVYLVSWFIFAIFQLPQALATNIETILICRFISGFAGSTPLANTGGVVHDLFGRDEGGYAVAIYALSSTDGPPFGNVSMGYIAQYKGWRWLFWVFLILGAAFFALIYFFLPETRDTILMMKKAKRAREETGYEKIYALHEQDRASAGRLWKVSLVRPFKFLFYEPITYLSALINGFTYGLIFLCNEAFPLIFGPRGWGIGAVNLTYGAFVVGALIGFALQPLQERFYHKRTALKGSSDPEARWASSLFGIVLLPAGLLIAAFTTDISLPFMAPLVGFTLFGIGFYMIITAILNYVVDGYGHYSASSLAGVVMVRNIVGAIFPLFAAQMYGKLGNQWATFLLAGLALFTVPIPFYFFFRGKDVRDRSEYCREHFDEDDI